MGMGKTAFTRGLCRGLNIDDSEVSSPTFALVHQYEGKDLTLYHFDMYRVDGVDDLYSTGFFDYLDYGGILAIEWSENIESALPNNTIYITISPVDGEPDSREITIEGDNRF
jgi:tRNA threonylcarbamoyladenosine biosynthesis protein TsaE